MKDIINSKGEVIATVADGAVVFVDNDDRTVRDSSGDPVKSQSQLVAEKKAQRDELARQLAELDAQPEPVVELTHNDKVKILTDANAMPLRADGKPDPTKNAVAEAHAQFVANQKSE